MKEKSGLNLYNTLSRGKEEFASLEAGVVKMYSCGPTVYNFAHIGNLRTYIFMDLLRRVLKRNGYSLMHVMNITDVGHLVSDEDDGEDKMLKGAREQKKTPYEIAEEYTAVFMGDIAALNIEKPEYIPKATEHIPQMLRFVEGLVDKGYGYEISDGIYFDVSKFKNYGKLSRLDLEEQLAGARVDVNVEKHHPADFALWKKAPKEHIMQWESRWGMGYPGWHIECSAMSMDYLGEVFDIHTGGVDHIPVHHENEIAQSEALLDKQAVRYWVHGEFMMVDNGKMSKSLKNTYTIADLRERGFEPLTFRYFCLNAHYRNKLNFTWEAMKAASVSYRRFLEGALQHKGTECAPEQTAAIEEAAKKFKADFDDAVNDDLNIPKALGIAWNVIRYPQKADILFEVLLDMDTILGLGLKEAQEMAQTKKEEIFRGETDSLINGSYTNHLSSEISELVEARKTARAEKNWKKSDEIRDQLKELGYAVVDTKDGTQISKI